MNLTTDLAKILEDHDRRVYRVEQMITSPAVVGVGGEGDNQFDEIFIGDQTLDTVPPDAPTNITVTPGANYGEIYADVEWTPPANGKAQSYYVELTRRTAIGPPEEYILERVATTIGTNYRFTTLDPNTVYSVRVEGINKIGIIGEWSTATQFTTGKDTTIPAQITGLSAGRGATSLVVTFNRSPDIDVDRANGLYEIWISNNSSFTGSYLKKEFTSATVVAFTDITSPDTMWARVRAIDASENIGPWSVAVAATAGGVIDSMIVAGLSAAKITFGTMDGDRITTNTLDVNKLQTSTLTSTTITMGSGGTIRIGSPPSNGIYINNLGIRAYRGSVEKFILDSSGNATFKGNVQSASITSSTVQSTTITGGSISGTTVTGSRVQTASSGRRIVLNPSFTGGRIEFYTSNGMGYLIGESLSGTDIMTVSGSNLGGRIPKVQVQSSTSSSSRMIYLYTDNMIRLDMTGTFRVDATAVLIPTLYHDSNVGTVQRPLSVTSSGWVGYSSTSVSTIRIKKDIQKLQQERPDDLKALIEKVLNLDVVSFFYKNDDERSNERFGLVAEWAQETLGEFASWFVDLDEGGIPDQVRYELIALALIPAIKDIYNRLETIQGV